MKGPPRTDSQHALVGVLFVLAFVHCTSTALATVVDIAELEPMITPISAGIPTQGNAASGAYTYYRWQAGTGTNGQTISFTVTDFGGDPDLFVSNTIQAPTRDAGQYTWESVEYSADQITILPEDTGRCNTPCYYYIGVYGSGSQTAQFSLLVYYSQEFAYLLDGQPQSFEVPKHGQVLFKISVTKPWNSLEITTTPTNGDPDVYVKVGSPITQYTQSHDFFSTSSLGQDRILISSADPKVSGNDQCQGSTCDFYILVRGFSESFFTITASTNAVTKVLQEGVPMVDHVGNMMYTYYKMTVFRLNTPITFTLTPQVGDPDMFVSCTNTHPSSSPGSFKWQSQNFGTDQVVISGADACPASGAAGHSPATYYIGVRGFLSNATYSLLGWVAHANHPVELQMGLPQAGTAAVNTMTYYMITHNGWSTDVEFIINTHSGRTLSYVNNVIDPATGLVILPEIIACNPDDCIANNYLWSSASSPDGDSITIPQIDLKTCTNCVFVLGVYAFGQDAQFTVTATTSEGVVTLVPGFPVHRTVDTGVYNNYRAVWWNADTEGTLTLTSQTGDADLFASYTDLLPTVQSHNWASARSSGPDIIRFSSESVPTCRSTGGAGHVCELFISVFGWRNATYTLSFTTDNHRPIVLSSGWPHYDEIVNASTYQYYTLYPPNHAANIHIMVNTYAGDADIFVSTDGQQASMNHHQYLSNDVGTGPDAVTIPAGACVGCSISIAVYAFMANTHYTIGYTLPGTITQLSSGLPAAGEANAREYSYFTFYNPVNTASPSDITISVTAFGGDPDVYVAVQNPNDPYDLPTAFNFAWASLSTGGDVVDILHTDSNYCQGCTYNIGVNGFGDSNTTFTITVSTETTTLVTLIDGVPQTGTALMEQYRFFTFREPIPHSNTTFQVTSVSGFAEIFITNEYKPATSLSPEQGNLPSSSSYQWSSFSTPPFNEPGMATVGPNNVGYHETTNGIPYTIGVYCSQDCTFNMVATTNYAAQHLQFGVPSTQNTATNTQPQFFSFDLPSNGDDIAVILSTVTGNPEVVMSTKNANPHCVYTNTLICNDYTWMMPAGSSVLNIQASDPCANTPASVHCTPDQYKAGRFYIGVVSGDGHPARFSITVVIPGHRFFLLDGEPQVVETAYQDVCQQHDPVSGVCTGNVNVKQGAVFEFAVGNNELGYTPEVSFSVVRACNWKTGCPSNLAVYANICNPSECTIESAYPSKYDFTMEQVSMAHMQTVIFRQEQLSACVGSTLPCYFYIGVYNPDCIGTQCASETFQVSFTSEYGMTVIPASCTENHFCPGPVGLVMNGASKLFAAYLGSQGDSTLNVQLSSCSGGEVTAYMCNDPSQCQLNPFRPAPPHNFQYSLSTQGSTPVLLAEPNAMGSWFFALQTDNPWTQYEMDVAHMTTLDRLMAPSSPPTVTIVSGTEIKVSWTAPTLTTGIQAAPKYNVYAVAVTEASTLQVNLNTACGLASLESAPQPSKIGGGRLLTSTGPGTSTTAKYQISVTTKTTNLEGLTAGVEYWVNVVAVCDGECMAQGRVAQSVAYTPTKVTPVATTPSGGLPGGVVALIVILILVIAGGVGFFIWRRNNNMNMGGSTDMGANQYNAL